MGTIRLSTDQWAAASRLPFAWGATDQEMRDDYPCAGLLDGPTVTVYRAVSVGAPSPVVWRWLCQLQVAPYSYDWLDNLGHRSPRTLTPGADRVEVGMQVMVFDVTEVVAGVEFTGRSTTRAARTFGQFAGTYRVTPSPDGGSRLVVRLDIARTPVLGSAALGTVRRDLLAWGDLVMMRNELLTLKELAERQVASAPSVG